MLYSALAVAAITTLLASDGCCSTREAEVSAAGSGTV